MKIQFLAFYSLLFIGLYSCKKDSRNQDKGNLKPSEENQLRRNDGNFLKTLNLNVFSSLTSEDNIGLTLFLNEKGIENKVDSVEVTIKQKSNFQKLTAILLGEEGLSYYIFGSDVLSPKIEPKAESEIEVLFYNSEKKELVGSKVFTMGLGTKSFNAEGKVISEKFIPGTYPICLMFDSSKIDDRVVYNFTFVGLIVDADSSIKFDDASQNSNNKKIIMTFGKTNKIPSDYLIGKGYYPDMFIMMLGLNNLGNEFYNLINSGRDIDYGLENHPNYWLSSNSRISNQINLEKIKKGGGAAEKKLKAKMQKERYIK